jgi:hypothetical protein
MHNFLIYKIVHFKLFLLIKTVQFVTLMSGLYLLFHFALLMSHQFSEIHGISMDNVNYLTLIRNLFICARILCKGLLRTLFIPNIRDLFSIFYLKKLVNSLYFRIKQPFNII